MFCVCVCVWLWLWLWLSLLWVCFFYCYWLYNFCFNNVQTKSCAYWKVMTVCKQILLRILTLITSPILWLFDPPQIQWFWRALRSFDQAERAKFLQFVTGTSKVPLQGFVALEGMNGTQKFQIHRDDRSTDRLPSAHTWFVTLAFLFFSFNIEWIELAFAKVLFFVLFIV